MSAKSSQPVPHTPELPTAPSTPRSNPMLDIIKRNPRSVATVLGGIAALAASSVWVLRSLAKSGKR